MNKKIKIAVTGAGGGVGQSIIKGLYETDYTIIGLDSSSLAAGLYGVDIAIKIPKVSDKNYLSVLLKICEEEGCKLLFPGLDTELAILSEHAQEFKKIGTTVVVSRPEVVEVADNKFLTYKTLSSNNIPVAKTFTLIDFLNNKKSIKFPVIVKPLSGGSRSVDVYEVESKEDLSWLVSKRDFNIDNFVISEKLEGDEYTCGTVNLDDKCWGVITMKRILRSGDTYKCFTVNNKQIEKTVYKVMEVLKPFGACNVQLRLKNGIPTVFEINARCSGTTGARVLTGFNEPKMIADFLIKGTEPIFKIEIVSILRYWKEMVLDNEVIEEVERKGKRVNKFFTKL